MVVHYPCELVLAKPAGRKILAHGASRWDISFRSASPGTGRKSMPHSFASLLVHLIFSTKNRACDLRLPSG